MPLPWALFFMATASGKKKAFLKIEKKAFGPRLKIGSRKLRREKCLKK
jgi:hypothetical protein